MSVPYQNEDGKTIKHTDGVQSLFKSHIKRFYLWLEWRKVNDGKPDEQKVDIRSVNYPYKVAWIKSPMAPNKLQFEDLPTEQEVRAMAQTVKSQRDRALILVTWETGASPIEILSVRIEDVAFDQRGAEVSFSMYRDENNEDNQLKTFYRYRQVPIAASVADLQIWLSMHPQKGNLNAPLWLSTGVDDGKLSYQQFHTIIKRAAKRAGIPRA
jgi:integrase/recombinase XerD